jgi:rod shape-determining protein MreD
MTSNILKNIFRFIFLILLQGIILNEVKIWQGYMIPYLYIMAILMLPFDTPNWLLLVIAFVCGICVDTFSNTLGLHASACLVLAFARPILLKSISPREGYESSTQPTLQDMGLAWFVSYAAILTFIHHTWLFYLEIGRFSSFFITFFRIILSSIFTVSLTIISQYFIFKSRGE